MKLGHGQEITSYDNLLGVIYKHAIPWWRHQMENFSALLAICAGNSPVIGDFPAQRPVTRSFDVCFDLRLNKRLSKQSWGWWFETLSGPLWRHRNAKAKTSTMKALMPYYIHSFMFYSITYPYSEFLGALIDICDDNMAQNCGCFDKVLMYVVKYIDSILKRGTP